MKTTIKAAILLLSGTIFFSQTSLADRPGNKPPPKDECTFQAKATACSDKLLLAYEALDIAEFKNSRDLTALTCKVAAADLKIDDGKFTNAELKLSDSVVKIGTLSTQDKILDDEGNPDYGAADDMAEAMEDARDCADGLDDL